LFAAALEAARARALAPQPTGAALGMMPNDKPGRGRPGSIVERAKSLLVHRNLNNLLLDGVGHQLRFVVDVEFAHQVELVRFDGFHA